MKDRNWIERHPVIAFYLLALIISWLGWIPQALYQRGLFPFDHPLLNFLGAGGPTLAAVIVLWVSGQKDQINGLFKSLFRGGRSWRWYVFVTGFWAAVTVIVIGILAVTDRSVPIIRQFALVTLVPVFLMMLLSNVWEEIGWRGFALPRLQTRFGDLKITFIMGLLWSLWHLPLMLNPASPMSGLPWYLEVLFSLSLTVIYTWLYLQTDRSLLFVSLFHAMSNTAAFVLLELGLFVSSYGVVVGIVTLMAVFIVLKCGTRRFTCRKS